MDRIIVYRLGSLGDAIIALPCFHLIASIFPSAERVLLTNEPVTPASPRMMDVLGGSGLVHRAIEYPIGLRSPQQLLRLHREIREVGAETLIYLVGPRGLPALARDLVFFRSCGIRRIVGAPTRPALYRNTIDPDNGNVEPECERIARCLAPLGRIDLTNNAAWDLRLAPAERERGEDVLRPLGARPFIAINMGGKAKENDWGQANWTVLVSRLGNLLQGYGLVFVGAKGDFERARSAAVGWRGPMVNLCGPLSPRETAAALTDARAFVGHDSGPLHLAAACGVRCVGLYSTRHRPRLWHPYGVGHRILHPKTGLASISVDEVLTKLLEIA